MSQMRLEGGFTDTGVVFSNMPIATATAGGGLDTHS
jgi:hypothetical protein